MRTGEENNSIIIKNEDNDRQYIVKISNVQDI
jgi:hypothetical protein